MDSQHSFSHTLSVDSFRRPVNLIFLSFLLLMIAITAMENVTVVLPLVLIGGAFLYWTYRNPEWWLFFAILFHAIFIQRTEGITVQEVLFGVYFYGYLGYWFVDRVLIRGQSLFAERAGAWLFGFLAVCLLSLLLAFLNNAVISLWFREILTTSILFLYFPAREVLKTEKGVRIVASAFIILSIGLALRNIAVYSSTTLAGEYYGELIGRRQPGSVHFFFAMVVLASNTWVHGFREKKFPPLIVITFIINLAALAASFTRGFWVGAVLSIVLLFFLVEPRKKLTIAVGSTITACLGIGGLLIVWGDLGAAVLSSIVSRFLSVGTALKDISFTNRIAESEAIVEAITRNPVLGYGFGSSFSYHNLFTESAFKTWYSHNGYLFLLFKVGIIGAGLFLFFYRIVLWRGFRLSRLAADRNRLLPIVQGVWAILVSMLVVTVTSNVFIERESLLLITLGAAFLMCVHEQERFGLSGFGKPTKPSPR